MYDEFVQQQEQRGGLPSEASAKGGDQIMKYFLWTLATLISFILLIGAWFHKLPLDITEVLGFITGALCVWLTVKENIWNWPIGIANSIFFVILFWNAKLFADMGLQWVYIVLGFYGWYWWLHGGKNKNVLHVTSITKKHALILGIITIIATYAMTLFLESIKDSAPFWDALTTVLSLVAQYMLTKKLLQNWYVWITADIIYIGLYAFKNLYLTSALYAIFMIMCFAGLKQWTKSLRIQEKEIAVHPGVVLERK
jgi:nicotinamide mononucleotide transporter